MERQTFTEMATSSQGSGWLAIASGAIGLAAFALLITAVMTRMSWSLSNSVSLLFRVHDVGVVVQSLLLIPVALGLRRMSPGGPLGISERTTAWGIGAVSFVALLLLLGVGHVVNDMAYMLPQGIFGAWLIVVNLRVAGYLPRWLRYFGVVVGVGLVLVGLVFPGLAIFVYPNMFKIPAMPVDNEVFQHTEINRILHLMVDVGSALGVVTLPIWTILTGVQLVKKEAPDPPARV